MHDACSEILEDSRAFDECLSVFLQVQPDPEI
jgi:hypothetical protein